jgi:type IV secretory pathway VirB6-like protein
MCNIDVLHAVGEQFIADARNNGTYTDRTGNLRSSIGYIIYKDGKPFNDSFPGNKTDGIRTWPQVASGQAKVPQKGFALVVVAGMNYALYVEAKNYDVITGSSYDAAEKLLKQSLAIVRKNL